MFFFFIACYVCENNHIQVAAYRDEVSVMDAVVRNMEEENLEHMKQLFEQRLSDVQISRCFDGHHDCLGSLKYFRSQESI